MGRAVSRMPVIQYGALPWRHAPDGLQILLVTTRKTRRWIVPKGWPDEGHTPQECACQEAYEEAGVAGSVTAEVIGVFSHRKLLKSGKTITCRIRLFAMEVIEVHDEWPEKKARESKWCRVDEALRLVEDVGLRRIIDKFCRAKAMPRAEYRSASH